MTAREALARVAGAIGLGRRDRDLSQELEKRRAIPGVEDAALAGQIPFGGNGDCWGFHANGRMKTNPVDDPCIERYGITPGYTALTFAAAAALLSVVALMAE